MKITKRPLISKEISDTYVFNSSDNSGGFERDISIDVIIRLLNIEKLKGATHITVEVDGVNKDVNWGDYESSEIRLTPCNLRYQTPLELLKEKTKKAVKKAIKNFKDKESEAKRETQKKLNQEAAEKELYLKLKQKFEK